MNFSSGCIKEKGVLYGKSYDFGYGISEHYVDNEEECAILSVSTEAALFWQFQQYNGRCLLKNSNSDRSHYGSIVSGNRRCGKY